MTRIALAYAGSLDGSAAIDWLRRRHGAEVITVTLDVGQGPELEAVRDRALALGARRAHVLDARDRFAQEFVLPALRADALHDGRVPMALALSRPLIAQQLLELAGIERASAVAHTGGGASGVSTLDRLLAVLAPGLPVLRPTGEGGLMPADLLAFGQAHGLGGPADSPTVDVAHRPDVNVWGRSWRRGDELVATAPWAAPAPAPCPAEPAIVEVTFTHGTPTALNGVALPLVELIGSLGTLAACHDVGKADGSGLRCDAPAAVLLHAAHRELTRAALPDEIERFSAGARAEYVNLVEQAGWFSPLRRALDAYFTAAQDAVNGDVRVRLFQGAHAIVATDVTPAPAGAQPLRVVPSRAQH